MLQHKSQSAQKHAQINQQGKFRKESLEETDERNQN